MRFTKEMIRIENGKHLIEFTQKKTGKIMTLPLHPKVLEILNKRNGMFPYAISDQKYNDYIKLVCELAKLKQLEKGSKLKETAPESGIFRKVTKMYKKWELVTSHIGRRSFSTNFYGKIPTSYLIYVTGHSTEVMFLNYIGKSNKDIAMELTNYF
jgi:integrase